MDDAVDVAVEAAMGEYFFELVFFLVKLNFFGMLFCEIFISINNLFDRLLLIYWANDHLSSASPAAELAEKRFQSICE